MLNLKIHSNVQQYVRKIDEQQRHIQNCGSFNIIFFRKKDRIE